MLRGVADGEIVGVNWGSSAFRAWRIAADGRVLAEHSEPSGVAGLDRAGMAAVADGLVERWDWRGPTYACGMIGSNVGWVEAPYLDSPADAAALARAVVPVEIGRLALRILPGIACRRAFDDAPDILRGEEVELLGFAASHPDFTGLAALPGTHSKWARLKQGRLVEFMTSMSGEIFDRLTTAGLLSSIVDGPAKEGEAFVTGVAAGRRRALGLSTLLFGARARVMRGELTRADAASYLRGLLIGAELADAEAVYGPPTGAVPLIGNPVAASLYAAALRLAGTDGRPVASRNACVRGFLAVHRAIR